MPIGIVAVALIGVLWAAMVGRQVMDDKREIAIATTDIPCDANNCGKQPK